VFAQLRDVLAAKDSAVMSQKNQNGSLPGPQRAKTNLLPIAIRKDDLCEPAAERIFHASSILSSALPTVKRSAFTHALGMTADFHHHTVSEVPH
jgi:hypothetical protein